MTRCVPPQGWCPAEAGVSEKILAPEVAELSLDGRHKTAVPAATEFLAFTGILSIPAHAKSVNNLLSPFRLCCLQSCNTQYPCAYSTRSQHNGGLNIITVFLDQGVDHHTIAH